MSIIAIQALRNAMDQLDGTTIRILELSSTRPEGWQKEYVGLRRRLQCQLTAVGEQGNACFRAGIGTDEAPAFRHAFNKFRSTLALHQANWPVIYIEQENPEYRASMARVSEAHRAFAVHIQRILHA